MLSGIREKRHSPHSTWTSATTRTSLSPWSSTSKGTCWRGPMPTAVKSVTKRYRGQLLQCCGLSWSASYRLLATVVQLSGFVGWDKIVILNYIKENQLMIAIAAGFVVVFTENTVPSLQALEVCYQLVPLSIQKNTKNLQKCFSALSWDKMEFEKLWSWTMTLSCNSLESWQSVQIPYLCLIFLSLSLSLFVCPSLCLSISLITLI